MLEHFWRNVQLVPIGLQVLMLNGMTGNVYPDCVPVNKYSLALPVTFLIFIVVFSGLYVLRKDWQYWWGAWTEKSHLALDRNGLRPPRAWFSVSQLRIVCAPSLRC